MVRKPRSDIGYYSIVPEWILLNATPNALRVWCLLCRYANIEDAAWPSQETMAFELDVSLDTIQRGVRNLADIGAIDIDSFHDGMKRYNLYCLNYAIPKGDRKPQKCGLDSRKNAVSVAAKMRHKREPIEREPMNETSPFVPNGSVFNPFEGLDR